MSVADLAKKLTVSRATVGNRIKRLEQSGADKFRGRESPAQR